MLKIDLGITDDSQDALLQRICDKAVNQIVQFTRRENTYVLANLTEPITDLAVIIYNRRGSEGLQSQGYSGVSESYLTDIPEPIKRGLYNHRLMGNGVPYDEVSL